MFIEPDGRESIKIFLVYRSSQHTVPIKVLIAYPGGFEPKDANTLAYQAGSAMAFIRDHDLIYAGLYMDEKLPDFEALGEETLKPLSTKHFLTRQTKP